MKLWADVVNVVWGFVATPFIISWIWAWHVVPLGLPPVGYWQSLGLSLLVAVFSPKSVSMRMYVDKSEGMDPVGLLVAELGIVLFELGALGVAWIAKVAQ